jgi:hypothetical protein
MIKPTVGRVVLYFPSDDDRTQGMDVLSDAPCDAHVVFVHSDTSVNLVVFDHEGGKFSRRKVPINIERFTGTPRAEWMPYQVGQAAKHEAIAALPMVETPAIASGRAS